MDASGPCPAQSPLLALPAVSRSALIGWRSGGHAVSDPGKEEERPIHGIGMSRYLATTSPATFRVVSPKTLAGALPCWPIGKACDRFLTMRLTGKPRPGSQADRDRSPVTDGRPRMRTGGVPFPVQRGRETGTPPSQMEQTGPFPAPRWSFGPGRGADTKSSWWAWTTSCASDSPRGVARSIRNLATSSSSR